MFDIGFSELFVIAIVALLVLGPERLPRAARFAGLWARRARAQWYSVKSELENELVDEDLKRSLLRGREQLQEELRQARDGLQHNAEAIRREFEDANQMTEGARTLPGEPLPVPPPASGDVPIAAEAAGQPSLPSRAPDEQR